ncbi:MAG: hypothetical protein KAH03_08595, partial [Cocleimonas sp.]|nr:hypothetical protein [Cocleimonas sp.]
ETTITAEYQQYNDAVNSLLAKTEDNIIGAGYFSQELNFSHLKITNDAGINNLFVGTIDPYPSFVVDLTYVGSTDLCIGDSLLLLATQNANYSYVWLKDSVIITGITTDSYYVKDSAIYSVEITNNNIPYTKQTKQITVKVYAIPEVELTTTDDTIFCVGNEAKLRTENSSTLTYSWYNNLAPIAGTTNTYSGTTTGFYQVQVSSDKGCINRSNGISLLARQPTAIISYIDDLTICDGDSVLLTSSSEPDYLYQWYFDGTLLNADTLISLYAKKSGAYQVNTTILENCSTLSTNSDVIVIPSPSATIIYSGDSVICNGEVTSLAANTGLGLTYLWMQGSDTIIGENSSHLNINTAGIYRAIVGFEGSCSRWSNTKDIV